MNKKKVLSVSIDHEGRHEGKVIPGKHLTVGESYDCDIVASVPGLPKGKTRFLDKSRKGYFLRIFREMDGTIESDGNSLSIRGLIQSKLLKKRGDSYLFHLPDGKECTISTGGLTLRLAYREITVPDKRAVKVDAAFRKAWISKEDYPFISVLVLSAVIHILTVAYLNTREIKKAKGIAAIEKIPARFAKLILEPPKTVIEKKRQPKTVVQLEEETKKEEDVASIAQPQPPVTSEQSKEKAASIAQPQPPVTSEQSREKVASITQPQPLITKEHIREKVKSRGLLSVIMAKPRPVNIPDSAIFRNIDDKMKDAKGGRAGTRVEDILADLDIKDIKNLEDDVSGDIGGITQGTAEPRDIGKIIREKKNVQIKETAKTTIVSTGDRNESEIYRVIQTYVGGLKYLYNNALKKDPSLKGKITVRLIISAEGKVTKAEVVSSTLNAPELENAIINRVYKWHFTEIQEGKEFITNYTFDFTPVG